MTAPQHAKLLQQPGTCCYKNYFTEKHPERPLPSWLLEGRLPYLQNLVSFLQALLLCRGTLLNASHKYPNVISTSQPETHAVSLLELHHFGVRAVIGLISEREDEKHFLKWRVRIGDIKDLTIYLAQKGHHSLQTFPPNFLICPLILSPWDSERNVYQSTKKENHRIYHISPPKMRGWN